MVREVQLTPTTRAGSSKAAPGRPGAALGMRLRDGLVESDTVHE